VGAARALKLLCVTIPLCVSVVPPAAPRRIAAAIREAGLEGTPEGHPLNYLQFFCLGKREAADQGWSGVSHQTQAVMHFESALPAQQVLSVCTAVTGG
jgi:hypothetical protein